jgi:hypothetical protein
MSVAQRADVLGAMAAAMLANNDAWSVWTASTWANRSRG